MSKHNEKMMTRSDDNNPKWACSVTKEEIDYNSFSELLLELSGKMCDQMENDKCEQSV